MKTIHPKQDNKSLVRTVQELSVRVRGYLPPHNFDVSPQRSGSVSLRVSGRFAPQLQRLSSSRTRSTRTLPTAFG
jgi:hypothetical protein